MGSLIEELKRQEEAALAEADRLRARIEELQQDLARALERASRLVIAREEVNRALTRRSYTSGTTDQPALISPRVRGWPPIVRDGGTDGLRAAATSIRHQVSVVACGRHWDVAR